MHGLVRSRASLALALVAALALSVCDDPEPAESAEASHARGRVAEALGDAPDPPATSVRASPPPMLPPHHVRTCCAFGMDLQAELLSVEVPLFELGNVIEPRELGRHMYDLPLDAPELEDNGLVYTCRGGWIDTAHVRENADRTFFLALRIAASPTRGATIVLPGDDGATTVVVSPAEPDLVRRESALGVASALASWAAFRIAIWHEVSTWYGFQTMPGFSERVSAFSPEDLYSDALGVRLGAALLEDARIRSVRDYEIALDRAMDEALTQLGAQPLAASRDVMASLDHRWWDSTRRLPDPLLVTRRAMPPAGVEVAPWLASDAFAAHELPPAIPSACRTATPRPLRIEHHLGGVQVRDLVRIEWLPGSWAGAELPFLDPTSHVVAERDLDALVAETRERMARALGSDFDAPRSP